ncbi:Histidyl-tRNA synthetase [hydrothermal vent metagenome]|uniref:histidine--tRNA ligase n=1 Tax=hydrothermal vent metagenome TaxID=652676 RepID=A0A3B1DIR7_9ZZZZ
MSLINPRTLRGFRDFLPTAMLARERLIEIARGVYRSYGFTPIDTPALEFSEILLGKGGDESDKQLFRFNKGKDDVSMRFDLTIPFARFAAKHIGELGTPFKRYHIGTVWRGERPQKGRYREFMQCDFDTIGTTANAADIETLMVIHDLMEKIGFQGFTIRVNNRLLLNGLLEQLGLLEQSVGVLRALDKLPKIGAEKVIAEMTEQVGTSQENAERILEMTSLKGNPLELLSQLEEQLTGNEQGLLGVSRLRELFNACQSVGLPSERIELDVSIARGLDYYTGTIYETFLSDLPGIGSVCSGGRYDNLTALFTKQQLPGVGASLGLDRLLAAMEELGLVEKSTTPALVFVPQLDAKQLGEYLRIGRVLRAANIATEVYPEAKKIGKQLQYANRKGFRIALIAGEEEFSVGTWQIKDLSTGKQQTVAEADVTSTIQELLREE